MRDDDFIVRFIRQLRTADIRVPLEDNAQRLADHLEWRITTPRNDGFDIRRTGNEEQDRSALAAWLEKAAHAGPYLAPSWGRNFSEDVAWLVRNNHDVNTWSVMLASTARHDPWVALIANEQGIEAAWAEMARRSSKK